MEKYATYNVYQHKITGQIKRVPVGQEKELEKLASSLEWQQLDYDPELKEE